MSIRWKVIDENFLDWLRENYDKRIPKTDYGVDSFKPFFGNLFEIGDLIYVTQISSPKERHFKLKKSLDFYKIFHPVDDKLIAVINLNYMFPVHKSLLSDLKYAQIDKQRDFRSDEEKNKYIDFLRIELQEINKLNLLEASRKIYRLKQDNPNNVVSQRSFDFKVLERACKEYSSRVENK